MSNLWGQVIMYEYLINRILPIYANEAEKLKGDDARPNWNTQPLSTYSNEIGKLDTNDRIKSGVIKAITNIYSTYKNDVPPMEWQAATTMWFEPMLQASTSQQSATRPSRQGTDCVQAGRCFVNTLGIIASFATGEPITTSVGGGKRTKKHKKHKRSKSKRSKHKRGRSKRSKSKRSKSKRRKFPAYLYPKGECGPQSPRGIPPHYCGGKRKTKRSKSKRSKSKRRTKRCTP